MNKTKPKKKTRLYFIRHGITEWNIDGRYQGSTDIELSETGKKQAKLLGERFKNIDLDVVYASPLKRAYVTAEAVSNAKGVPIIKCDNFQEINFGEWEGHTSDELRGKYGTIYDDFLKSPMTYEIPGEGSFKNAMNRGLAGVNEILEKHKGENIAIVSHGALLRVMMIGLLEFDNDMYFKTWLDNTSITVIDVYEDGRKMLMTLNDKAHLEKGE